jgi:hypothetical protein
VRVRASAHEETGFGQRGGRVALVKTLVFSLICLPCLLSNRSASFSNIVPTGGLLSASGPDWVRGTVVGAKYPSRRNDASAAGNHGTRGSSSTSFDDQQRREARFGR